MSVRVRTFIEARTLPPVVERLAAIAVGNYMHRPPLRSITPIAIVESKLCKAAFILHWLVTDLNDFPSQFPISLDHIANHRSASFLHQWHTFNRCIMIARYRYTICLLHTTG
jgi:hypothetical protein